MLLYYITDRKQFLGDEALRRVALLGKIAEAARCGVDLIQLREKDLFGRELESLAVAAVRAVREHSTRPGATRLLINSRTDIAIACGADGVHLTSNDVGPGDVRAVWRGVSAGMADSLESPHPNVAKAAKLGWGTPTGPVIVVSCHAAEEVARAAAAHADYAVFGPVFEKQGAPDARPAGLEGLRSACRFSIPVLALGGITLENASKCVDAGAAGIAAIRLFQQNEIGEAVARMRG